MAEQIDQRAVAGVGREYRLGSGADVQLSTDSICVHDIKRYGPPDIEAVAGAANELKVRRIDDDTAVSDFGQPICAQVPPLQYHEVKGSAGRSVVTSTPKARSRAMAGTEVGSPASQTVGIHWSVTSD